MDATETDDESLVGDIAHMVAESDDGPRADPAMPTVERNRYANLLLLCKVDHKRVDDQPLEYTLERLQEMKREHEARVRAALSPEDRQLLQTNAAYASIVDEWLAQIEPEYWLAWSSFMLSANGPSMSAAAADRLAQLGEWLLSRVWPKRHEKLERAFGNFRRVLNDLLVVFHKHSESHGDSLVTRRFYKIPEWNPTVYHKLADDYDYHVGLVNDLVLELTRAANYVCDMVRMAIDPGFRMREGVLLVQSGPFMDLSYRTYRAEYEVHERVMQPYPGLENFKSQRFSRDVVLGRPHERENVGTADEADASASPDEDDT